MIVLVVFAWIVLAVEIPIPDSALPSRPPTKIGPDYGWGLPITGLSLIFMGDYDGWELHVAGLSLIFIGIFWYLKKRTEQKIEEKQSKIEQIQKELIQEVKHITGQARQEGSRELLRLLETTAADTKGSLYSEIRMLRGESKLYFWLIILFVILLFISIFSYFRRVPEAKAYKTSDEVIGATIKYA